MSVVAVTDATAVIRFRIGGLLRFLSHAETLRLLERAIVRAGVPIKYSQGFNPHPKMSLPLPRSVGVDSDDELLAVRVFDADGFTLEEDSQQSENARAAQIKAALSAELPDGIEIQSVDLVKSNTRFHPSLAEYVLCLRPNGDQNASVEEVSKRSVEIQDSDSLIIERSSPGQREPRRIDVRPFIESIGVEGPNIVVKCHVSNAGTIRVDEILSLLDLEPEDLDGPIRRTRVQWDIA